jgi:hypothetical protein
MDEEEEKAGGLDERGNEGRIGEDVIPTCWKENSLASGMLKARSSLLSPSRGAGRILSTSTHRIFVYESS